MIFLGLPPLAGSRKRAQAVIQTVVRGPEITVDGRHCLALTPSFADELVIQLCVQDRSAIILANMCTEFSDLIVERANVHGVGHLVTV